MGNTLCKGIYYVVRYPEGWRLVLLPQEGKADTNHSEWWEETVVELVASKWVNHLGRSCTGIKAEIVQACYGFPRGRVSKIRSGRFLVNHGDNIESFISVSKAQIEEAFGIVGRCLWRFDEHEQCTMEDKELVRECLQIREDWRAV